MNAWWIVGALVGLYAASRLYCAIANAFGGEDPEPLPEHWESRITRRYLWWIVEGIYSGPATNTPEVIVQVVVQGWTWTRRSGERQVGYWIDDAIAAGPASWLEGPR